MLRPDLDLYIVTPQHDWDKLLKVSDGIMRSKYFREFWFMDRIDFDDEKDDTIIRGKAFAAIKGYYFLPWVQIGDQLWKIDIWLITKDQYKGQELTGHFKKLLDKEKDNSKKIAILEIKEAMKQNRKYIKGVDGRMIYQAVLENNVTTPQEFEEFLKSQKEI